VLLHCYEGWDRFTYVKQSKKKKNKAKVHCPDRIKGKKKLKKEHYTGGQDLQLLLESVE
jgi:hypothetical protein